MRSGGNARSVSLVAHPSIAGRLAKVNPLLHINIEDVAATREIVAAGLAQGRIAVAGTGLDVIEGVGQGIVLGHQVVQAVGTTRLGVLELSVGVG